MPFVIENVKTGKRYPKIYRTEKGAKLSITQRAYDEYFEKVATTSDFQNEHPLFLTIYMNSYGGIPSISKVNKNENYSDAVKASYTKVMNKINKLKTHWKIIEMEMKEK